MPEAAEVRRMADMLDRQVGFRIEKVEVMSGRYSRQPPAGIEELEGMTISGATCKGKLLVIRFVQEQGIKTPPIYALSTMGMTGEWVENNDLFYGPKHARIRFTLDDGRELYYVDQRNFGTFKLVFEKEMHRKWSELGPNIMDGNVDLMDLGRRIGRYAKKKTIAEALLDQRIFCGVGNYIRADAMYIARINPRRPALSLTFHELQELVQACGTVIHAAYTNANFSNVCYGRSLDKAARPIVSYEDKGGRTVWWCPTWQNLEEEADWQRKIAA